MNEVKDVTAVLLCGGKGERLRPFTESFPKPLVPLRGRPLLDHLLDYLVAQGIRRFALCVGYKAEAIRSHVQQHPRPSCEIILVDSGEAASMTTRVLDARAHVRGRTLVCYGDTLANVDLGALVRGHQAAGALASVSVHPLRSPFGVVVLDGAGERVVKLEEKPLLPHWINIGYILCEPAALDLMERDNDLVSYLEMLARRGALRAHRHQGKHLTVNTAKERSEAEQEIDFFTLPEGM
jgi:glucose-1-phosphate cytidylyltransferase